MRAVYRIIKKMSVMTLALCLLVTAVCAPVKVQAENLQVMTLSGDVADGMVRVFLSSLGNPSQLNLTVNGSYSFDCSTATAISRGSKLTVNFDAASGKLTLTHGGSTKDMGDGFTLYRHESDGENGIRISQARTNNIYPGDIQFVVKKTSSAYKLYTIAHVFIEEYLYGVLPYEMGSSAPLEALKAQCVSARTYTVRAMQGASSNIYDVVDTTNDQVYNGTPSGSDRCKQAVDATRGLIAMNGTAFAATYYTASNGGQIESVSNIWGSSSYDYVRVKDDPFDLNNANSQVRTLRVSKSGTQSNQSLNALLVAKAKTVFGGSNVTITAVHAVTPHTPRYAIPSRLYTKIDFDVTVSCDGASKRGTLTFDIFSELESSLAMSINGDNNEMWNVTETATEFVIRSRRFGHGTGLSQRGAMKMGELGYTYDEILAFYFEGCTLKQQTFYWTIGDQLEASGDRYSYRVEPVKIADVSSAYGIVYLQHMEAEAALRMAASAGADVIMGIPHGAVVRVHAAKDGYYLVSYGEASGYVHQNVLSVSGKTDGKAQTIPTLESYGTVNNEDYLNLRAGAGTNYDILAQIPAGTVLPLFDINGEWAYTQYGRESGYVSMDYVTKNDRYKGDADDGDACGAEVIASGGVKMRTTASTNAYSPMNVPEGVIVKVKYNDGSWSEVYYAGVTGFVPTSALKMNNISVEEVKDTPGSGEQYAQVSSESTSLNMRTAANLSSTVMMEIPRGAMVIVTKESGDWCAVRYRGMNGYCMTKYLTLGITGDKEPAEDVLTARVTTESGSLNLRKSASKSAKILTTIPRNTVITVIERGKTWSEVKYNGKTGFVMNEFLTFGDSEELPDSGSSTKPGTDSTTKYSKAKVTTASGSLNLRKKASSSATILTTIPRHTVIDVLDIDGTWTKVTYNGKTGYVKSTFLTYLDDTADTPSVPDTPTTPPAEDKDPAYARVTTESGSLNLRKKASSSANILTTIPRHEVIEVISRDGKWTKVTYNGKTGYVMSSFLTFLDEAPEEKPEEDEKEEESTAQMAQVTTKKGSLNLRKRASSSSSILTTVPQYAYIQVISRDGSWTKVTYNGYTGYVMTSFLTFVKGDVTPGVPDAPSDEGETPWARVTTEQGSLNLRAKGSSGAKILDTIPRHEIIPVLEKGSVWSKVEYDGTTGYVKNSFLTFLSKHPNAGKEEEKEDTSATVNPNEALDDTLIDLNDPKAVKALPAGASTKMYKGCSEKADVLATILRGEYVVLLSQGEDWSRVEYEGKMGYLPTELLGL
ncbi:MAG: SH3 domain-containing protein [Clostridia bacterium]|nr:SH3 domain-containing protein [Clostridia bacterium]